MHNCRINNFEKTQIILKNFLQGQGDSTVCIFGPTLTPIYPMKISKSKKVNISRKKIIYLPIQSSQNQGPISSQFSIKTIITFCFIWVCLGTNGPRVKGYEVKTQISTTFLDALHWGLVGSARISVIAYFQLTLFQL